MSEFQKISLEECAERLLAMERPQIVMHVHPDGDTVGSAAALARALLSIGKEPILLCGDPIPERLCFLTEGLTVGTPEKGRETLAVDVASPAQLGPLREILTGELAPRLQIDHHERGERFADTLIAPDAAAAGEIVFALLTYLEEAGKIPSLSKETLTCLYASISSDTGGFRFANTTADTHRIAASLHERGVDAAAINRLLFASHSESELRAEAMVISSIRTECDGALAYAAITLSMREKEGLPLDAFETAVDIVRSLRTAKIAAVLKESKAQSFKVSLRANQADVASVAAQFGGGGHKLAAGCTIKAENAEKAWEMLAPYLKKALLPDENS